MRVVGALYGVRLAVTGDPDPGHSVEPVDLGEPRDPAKRGQSGEPVGPRKAKGRRRAATDEKSRSGLSAAGADSEAAEQVTVPRSSAAPSNAEVRSWARKNGLTVSDRGKVPASVLSAYRKAHGE